MDSSLSQFTEFLPSLNLSELKLYREAVDNEILNKLPKSKSSPQASLGLNPTVNNHDHVLDVTCHNVEDYISYNADFVDDTVKDLLLAETDSFFDRRTRSSGLQNCFLSEFSEPYVWQSKNGLVVNNPKHMDHFPVIKSVMKMINETHQCNLNSVLVTYYRDGASKISLHDDSEESIDSSQPICVLSLGVNRKVEFVGKDQDSYRLAAKSISPDDCSLYTMKAGCQDLFLHRVRMNKKIKGERISLSFRCFVPKGKQVTAVTAPRLSTPLKVNTVTSTSNGSVFHSANDVLHDMSPIKKLSFELNSNSQGYCPYSRDKSSARTAPKSDEKICVIFGTSITDRVDGARMSRGSRTVINCSNSGANISDVTSEVEAFCNDNPRSVANVDKIIFCIGTNEVKWFNTKRRNINVFRAPLANLVKLTKSLFPHAHIIFRCVLPIRIVYKYTAIAVEGFNRILFDVCREFGCIYSDEYTGEFLKYCYCKFFDYWYMNYNADYYWDNWHLNDKGIKILCRALKNIIYHNLFNPLPRYH